MSVTDQNRIDVGRALNALRKIVRALRVSARATEKELGISGAQLFVLQQLAEKPASSINDLAERTMTHQSSVSVVVARLAEQGLVLREASRQDARRSQIALTPAGQALLARSGPTMQVRLAEGLTRLPEVQREQLVEGLDAWLRATGIDQEEAALFFEESQ